MKAFNSTLNLVSKKREASGKPAGLKTRCGLKSKQGLKSKAHLKTVSTKMATRLQEYSKIVTQLNCYTHGYSELSGKYYGCGNLQTHHILGRGKHLLNVFTLILLGADEHENFTNGDGYKTYPKDKLLATVYRIRVAQGYNLKDFS